MQHDRGFWAALAADDYALPPGEDRRLLLDEVIGMLGDPDPDVRDEIGYTVIASWIVQGVLTPDDLRHVRAAVTANLRAGLGERDTDSVILRSFSALALSLVAYGESKRPFLTAEEYDLLVNDALDYLTAERDLRGYVPGKGWLHAAAHTADLIKFLARSPQATAAQLDRMLTAVAARVATADQPFTHGEDERLTLAVGDLCKRGVLGPDSIEAFADRLREVLERKSDGGFDTTLYAFQFNVKQFVRTLIVWTLKADPPPTGLHDLQTRLLGVLQ